MRMPPLLPKLNDGCLPTWEVPQRGACSHCGRHLDSEVYRCCLTELQLQAIVNQQGIEGTGEFNLDMIVVNGVSVSKWHLDSVTYGVEVSDTLKESVKKYLQQFVGIERVFPTQNGAPRIMTEFLNKPYRFELRDGYTKGPNRRPLPTIKASYYHEKPATQKVLEHFCRSTSVVASCDNPRCLLRLVIVPKRDPGAPKTS
jgi:hypothetical protein